MINWDNFKCRCSGIGKIMANSRSNPQLTEKQSIRLDELEGKSALTEAQKIELSDLRMKKENSSKVILSDTAIEYLMEVYAKTTYGMVSVKKELEIDQMQKGKLVENDSIQLLSVVDGTLYAKNDEQIENDFLCGEPDVFDGETVMAATKIIDIKSCFDYPSFLKKINTAADPMWETQVRGYCDITGAKVGEIAHVLVNMPDIMIADYKRKIFYKMDVISEESPEFTRKWDILLNSMIFDKIPAHQRVFRILVEPFSEFERQKVYDRVKVCREWLWKFDEMYQKLNTQPLETEKNNA